MRWYQQLYILCVKLTLLFGLIVQLVYNIAFKSIQIHSILKSFHCQSVPLIVSRDNQREERLYKKVPFDTNGTNVLLASSVHYISTLPATTFLHLLVYNTDCFLTIFNIIRPALPLALALATLTNTSTLLAHGHIPTSPSPISPSVHQHNVASILNKKASPESFHILQYHRDQHAFHTIIRIHPREMAQANCTYAHQKSHAGIFSRARNRMDTSCIPKSTHAPWSLQYWQCHLFQQQQQQRQQ